MKKIMKITALAVLVLGVTAVLQPANAICSSARLISSGYSYVVTPGCEGVDCGSGPSSVTDDVTGAFWSFGEGDETVGAGIDSGSFTGFLYVYPGYSALITSTWAADPGIDGCIDAANTAINPNKCMAVLVMDNSPATGEGAFALITAAPDSLTNFNFDQGQNITLTTLNKLNINASVRTGGGTGVDVTVGGVSLTDIESGLWLDPACPANGGIAGYQVFAQEVPRDDPAPMSNNRNDWTAVGDVVPLGSPTTASLACSGDTDQYVTAGIVFDSNYRNVWLSGNSTKINCGANLADPEDIEIERKPRSRELPRSRSRER